MGDVDVTASWTATVQKVAAACAARCAIALVQVYLDQLVRLPEGQVQCHEESNVKWYQEAQVAVVWACSSSMLVITGMSGHNSESSTSKLACAIYILARSDRLV